MALHRSKQYVATMRPDLCTYEYKGCQQSDIDTDYEGWEWLCSGYTSANGGSVNAAVLHDMLHEDRAFVDLGGCLLQLALAALWFQKRVGACELHEGRVAALPELLKPLQLLPVVT